MVKVGAFQVQAHSLEEKNPSSNNNELKGIKPVLAKHNSLEHQMFNKRELPKMYSGLYDCKCESRSDRINAAIPLAQLTSTGCGGG